MKRARANVRFLVLSGSMNSISPLRGKVATLPDLYGNTRIQVPITYVHLSSLPLATFRCKSEYS